MNVENEVQIDRMLTSLTKACTDSVKQLHQTMTQEPWDLPHVYTVPKMSVSVKLSLSYSKETVKGVLLRKSTSATQADALSTINLDIVAVPKVPASK